MKASLVKEGPWFKLLILFMLSLLGTFVFLLLGMSLLPVFYGIGLSDLQDIIGGSVSDFPEVFKFLQGFNTIGTFMAPALLAAYLFNPYPSTYLALDHFPRRPLLILLLGAIIALSGVALSDLLYRFTLSIEFPAALQPLQEYFQNGQRMMDEHIQAFLVMENFGDFVEVFLILAILPALCEETLFRGLIQPLFIKGFRNVHLGIIVTSVVFGLLHQQFYSFLSIMALSVVLGYMRIWSQSLWLPVFMHLINNGSILIAVYFFGLAPDELQSADEGDWTQSLGGLGLFVLSMMAMWWVLRKQGSGQG